MVLRLTPNQKIEVRFLYPLLSISGHMDILCYSLIWHGPPPAWMATMRDRGGARPNYKLHP